MSYLDTLKELIEKNKYRHHRGAEPVNTDKYDVVDPKTGELNFVHPNYKGGVRYNKDWMIVEVHNKIKKKKGKVPTVEQIVERMEKKIENEKIEIAKKEQKKRTLEYKRNKSKKKKKPSKKKSTKKKKKGGRRYTKKRRR
jgi:cobalamin-dependent methionine synthase I